MAKGHGQGMTRGGLRPTIARVPVFSKRIFWGGRWWDRVALRATEDVIDLQMQKRIVRGVMACDTHVFIVAERKGSIGAFALYRRPLTKEQQAKAIREIHRVERGR